jgi:hypothetical protein
MTIKKLIYISVILLLASCSPVRHSFDVNQNISTLLFKRITQTDRKKEPLFVKTDTVEIFSTVFKEIAIEKNNVVESSLVNTWANADSLRYSDFQGVTQKIYLFKIKNPTDKTYSFLYFSARFQTRINKKTRQTEEVCVGFGPSYFGKLVKIGDTPFIHFEHRLKAKKKGNHFELVSNGPADIKLVLNKEYTPGEDHFNVLKLIECGANKIGGRKELVFNIENIFGYTNALRFTYSGVLKRG